MIELPATTTSDTNDEFFLERLDMFCSHTLSDAINSFAAREMRPVEQVRRSVAAWHCKQLFSTSTAELASPLSPGWRHHRQTLNVISEQLESLRAVAAVESFVLAVAPHKSVEDADAGFLGGTLAGRQFWREFRHGGEGGAKAFRHFCARTSTAATQPTLSPVPQVSRSTSIPSSSRPTAPKIKAELYDAMRRSLRSTSGVRTAEMKWTNQERLHAYGVRLVGWPADVPLQNPSILKATQNAALLDALRKGSMRFERLNAPPGEDLATGAEDDTVDEDISWACNDAGEVRASTLGVKSLF
ncbi:hypothetical protein FB107DRAFT_222236 [Schizophyllum commune]